MTNTVLTSDWFFRGEKLVVHRHADVTEDLLLISVSIQLEHRMKKKSLDLLVM